MSLTYDIQLKETGGSPSTVSGIAVSNYQAGSLTQLTNYEFRVRAVETTSGVIILSPWSSWQTFSTIAEAVPIISDIGLITNSQTVNSITTEIEVPVVIVETYDVRLTKSGESPVFITGLTASEAFLTDLISESLYSVAVRQVSSANGLIILSPWVSTSFNTLAVSSDITTTLGAINNTSTVHEIVTAIEEPPEIVSSIGSITNTQDIHDVQTIVEQEEIVSSLGAISNTSTAHSITTVTAEEIPATSWAVEVIDLVTNEIVHSEFVSVSEFQATGLIAAREYKFRVKGRAEGFESEWTNYVQFITDSNLVAYATTTASEDQLLDVLSININDYYVDNSSGILELYLSTETECNQMAGTFDSKNLILSKDSALNWTATHIFSSVGGMQSDELSGRFAIKVNESLDTIRI